MNVSTSVSRDGCVVVNGERVWVCMSDFNGQKVRPSSFNLSTGACDKQVIQKSTYCVYVCVP